MVIYLNLTRFMVSGSISHADSRKQLPSKFPNQNRAMPLSLRTFSNKKINFNTIL